MLKPMARLNEAAAPVESIESLKRKFMRQNRDIARANSAQSLRIRNLENETSKLLAENLALREQILHLKNELENGKAQRVAEQVGDIKAQLEAKLLEIGTLIIGLGHQAPRKSKSPQSDRLTTARVSLSRSLDQKNWKNTCTLSDAVGGQDGRLPPIMENKAYPRRTLERRELMAIVANSAGDSTDSPEIGPPPVSQFVDEDPVKCDLPTKAQNTENDEISTLDPTLSINLEQRKKRRDSASVAEVKRASRFEPTLGTREAAGSLKTGAKRKLSVRDDDENQGSGKATVNPPDNFEFTRVTGEERTKQMPTPPAEKPVNKFTRDLAVARGTARGNQSTTSSTTNGRKVLAPKSVNDSPRKAGMPGIRDEVRAAKVELSCHIVKERPREKKMESVPDKPPPELISSTIEIQPDPKTPAGFDLLSPSSSQPSTTRTDSRDTPPPPDLGPGTEGQRPSRRARGSISYAEPNLRDKMRRPTKDLVDAVTRDGKTQRTSFIKLEGDAPTTAATIKAEPEPDDAWKGIPIQSSVPEAWNSPLSSKASTPVILSSGLVSHRKRRESSLHQDETEMPGTGSGSSISALLASTRRARARAEGKDKMQSLENEAATLAKAMAELDVYEFRGSSPTPENTTSVNTSKDEKTTSRSSRRQPIPSKDSSRDRETASIEELNKSALLTSRRRSSALGLRNASMNVESGKQGYTENGSRRTTSTTSDDDDDTTIAGKGDRILRRRSMML